VRGLDRRRGDIRVCFEQNAAAFTAVSQWGARVPTLGAKPHFFNVGLDENKAALPGIDMQAKETIGANGGKKVVTVEVNKRIRNRCV
jgi:hypothetical protein